MTVDINIIPLKRKQGGMDTNRIEGEEDAVANEMRVFHRPHPSIPRSTHPDFGFVGQTFVGPSVCTWITPHAPHTEGSLACPGILPMVMTASPGVVWSQPVLDVSRETPQPIVMNTPHTRHLGVDTAITFFREHDGARPPGAQADELEAWFRQAQEDGRAIDILDADGDVIATVPAGNVTVAHQADHIVINSSARPIHLDPAPGEPEKVEEAYAHAEDEIVRIDDERLPAELLDEIVAIATGTEIEQELHMDESTPLAMQVMQAVADAGMTIVDDGNAVGMHYELTATGENLGPVYADNVSIIEGLERAIARREEILAGKVEPTTLYPVRHLGRIPVTNEALHRLLGVPDNLRIVGMYYDEPRLQLMITLEGDSLFPVPPGTHPMELSGEWKYVAEVDEDGETTEYGRLEWFPEPAERDEDMWGGRGV